jgi:hypothetical protein
MLKGSWNSKVGFESPDIAFDVLIKSTIPAQINLLAGAIGIILAVLLIFKDSPAMYYVYVAFPILFWVETAKQLPVIWAAVLRNWKVRDWINTAAGIAIYSIGMELLVSDRTDVVDRTAI